MLADTTAATAHRPVVLCSTAAGSSDCATHETLDPADLLGAVFQ